MSRGIIRVEVGACRASHPDYGKLIGCFICGALRPAYGLAHVSYNRRHDAILPLCEACTAADPARIIHRKLCGKTEH